MIAAEHQHACVMTLLIGAGCDVRSSDLQRRTALHHAALHDGDVTALLRAGADPDAVDYLNETPLHGRWVTGVSVGSRGSCNVTKYLHLFTYQSSFKDIIE